jgi:hypothetical protein
MSFCVVWIEFQSLGYVLLSPTPIPIVEKFWSPAREVRFGCRGIQLQRLFSGCLSQRESASGWRNPTHRLSRVVRRETRVGQSMVRIVVNRLLKVATALREVFRLGLIPVIQPLQILPYFREEVIGERLGQVLRDIRVPDEILVQLQKSLLNDRSHQEALNNEQRERYSRQLAQVNRRMDLAYQDKLDGKISEEFWARKSADWQQEEHQIRSSLKVVERVQPERYRNAARILELANKAYSLYVSQDHPEKAKLLKMVLSNCGIDAISLYPTYRKPFDLIFQKARTEEWCARRDSNTRPSA